ncbi:MAG: GNAT family N-acetyltransferase [Chlorogloeopsis fritschii C42_A2020_084]|uniref:GNAT family N-acetyltransferase n=1 Tax=Chlorogloeopsis fritschii TaxID=1124 RepID=UPI001A0C67DE|nr:GNAT family N-acetyltransferase [Chlorogloeopsis fritschii]MBF2005118.1 GNAT family N-acetyltransferase [Chlorogloeopsis fritschii C42_A2020_084]
MRLTFDIIDEQTARYILTWRYEPPYDFYNSDSEKLESALATLLNPENCYYSIWDESRAVIGYCCFGNDAQVPGGCYSQEALDVGMELRPDRTGKGQGTQIIQAVIVFARQNSQASKLRVTIAAFNQRALRAWQKAGFEIDNEFVKAADRQRFFILMGYFV